MKGLQREIQNIAKISVLSQVNQPKEFIYSKCDMLISPEEKGKSVQRLKKLVVLHRSDQQYLDLQKNKALNAYDDGPSVGVVIFIYSLVWHKARSIGNLVRNELTHDCEASVLVKNLQ